MPKIISSLILNSLVVTSLISCDRAGTGEAPTPTPRLAGMPMSTSIPTPSTADVIAKLTDLTIALGAEMHKRELLEQAIVGQMARQRQLFEVEISNLQAKIRDLERR